MLDFDNVRFTAQTGYAAFQIRYWGNNTDPDSARLLDPDHDGLNNGLEYALGLNPSQPNGSPGSLTGNLLSFTKGSDAIASGDVTYVIQTSDDLGLTDPWAAVVTQAPPNSSATIFYTLPTGKPKVFARLVITIAPR